MSDKPRQLDISKIHTLVDLFHARVAASPGQPAYRQYLPGLDRWHSYTWNDLASRVNAWAASLNKEQLQAGDRIAIMASNRPDWIAADIAAQSLGLVVVALFSEDTAGSAGSTLAHAGASLLVVEDPQWWVSIRANHELPDIRRVVALKPATGHNEDSRLIALSNWLDQAGSAPASARHIDPDDLAVICYTSGTSGQPKGVMLSHNNILSNVKACHQVIPMQPGDIALSFLPLAHMFERTAGYYHAILAGAEVAFNRDIKHLTDDLREVRPTVLVSVPRVFERFYTMIQRRVKKRPWILRLLFIQARNAGWRHFLYEQKRGPRPPMDHLGQLLARRFGKSVLDALGGRVRLAVSGGAPLSPEIAKTFIGLGLPIVQGYGLTEASPVVSTNHPDDNDPESVGLPLPGVQTRRGSNGELQVRGPNVMLGYWRDDEATAAVLSADGWLRTGDKISRLHSDRLFVVGRIKELIVMSNGEKAAPALLEQELLLDELVEQVIVIGEARPFLSALIVPNRDVLNEFCRQQQLPANDPDLLQAVLDRLKLDLDNQPRFAQIHRIALLDEPWTTENHMLTPTHKPRRRHILHRYADRIDALYRGHFSPEDTALNYHVDIG